MGIDVTAFGITNLLTSFFYMYYKLLPYNSKDPFKFCVFSPELNDPGCYRNTYVGEPKQYYEQEHPGVVGCWQVPAMNITMLKNRIGFSSF